MKLLKNYLLSLYQIKNSSFRSFRFIILLNIMEIQTKGKMPDFHV